MAATAHLNLVAPDNEKFTVQSVHEHHRLLNLSK